jgi:hypothetical protein
MSPFGLLKFRSGCTTFVESIWTLPVRVLNERIILNNEMERK